MRSLPEFLAIAALVTLTPGPAFALLVQVAAVHGWRIALANIAGNAVGVLIWAALSALGVSALLTANRVAYDVLHVGGALYLLWLGGSALFGRAPADEPEAATTAGPSAAATAARRGFVNSVANPKLAIFFVSLFPQFIVPGTPVLPVALAMALMIVACDFVIYGSVALLIDRFGRRALAPRVLTRVRRASGGVFLFFGLRLLREAR